MYGLQFIIHSDHKPLMYIFDEAKTVPLMASARIQQWAFALSANTYTIQYKAGKDHANVDGLGPGVIQEFKGPVSHTVELEYGHVFSRPVDHLRARIATAQPTVEMNNYDHWDTITEPSQVTRSL